MNPFFLIDETRNISVSWEQFVRELSEAHNYYPVVMEASPYSIFKQIVLSLLASEPITILDSDLSHEELENLGYTPDRFRKTSKFEITPVSDAKELINLILRHADGWSMTLYTSGTTGLPKKVEHTFHSLTRWVRLDENRKEDIWGFAYNPTHMAGLQVFFQALMNLNTIVYLFGNSRDEIFDSIDRMQVTNISATPTFFRLLMPVEKTFSSVKKITTGGEKFDIRLKSDLTKLFPQAKVRNVYASTEAGSLFSAVSDVFTISPESASFIKIEAGELLIHESLLGYSESLLLKDGWYYSGDLVELIDNDPVSFRFIHRKNDLINVGGYKVNPSEVEEILNAHESIKIAKVYGRPNSVMGTILCCDIVLNDGFSLTVSQIREYLGKRLQPFKVPRIVNFTDRIETTRTGKIKRNQE
ncbi:MAG: fatty acid--CoA ligase family protein [Lentimicrobium sp.]